MGINKKIYVIQQNREAAVAAIESYLDYIYSLQQIFLDENMELKPDLQHDKQAEELLKSSTDNATLFEIVRAKLQKEDFNLSPIEINYIALAFFFASNRSKMQVQRLTAAIGEMQDVIEILLEGEDSTLKESMNLKN